MRKLIRSPGFIVLAGVLFCFFLFIAPLCWFEIKTRYWEAQIRQHQDPAALQIWATNLLATYNETNVIETLGVTNKPPPGFPVATSPDVILQNGKMWGGGYYVELR